MISTIHDCLIIHPLYAKIIFPMSHVHSLHSGEIIIIWYRGIVAGVLWWCRYWRKERLGTMLSINYAAHHLHHLQLKLLRLLLYRVIFFSINLSSILILFSSNSVYLSSALSYASTSCCTTPTITTSNWSTLCFFSYFSY